MPEKKTALVWLKTNLRLRDNEYFVKAIAENDEVIPFYCLDDRLLASSNYGFKKAGGFRLQFLAESLQDLDDALRKAGSGLTLLKGAPEEEIARLAKAHGATAVYAETEVAPEEVDTESRVEAGLRKLGCRLFRCECRNLFHPADLPFSIAQLPDIFTVFRKKTEFTVPVRPLFDAPQRVPSPVISPMNLDIINELTRNATPADPRAAIQFKGGAQAAQERLDRYFYHTKALLTYKETRNGLVGDLYSSKFSAWLALGCISAKDIYYQVKAFEATHGANDSTYWLIFELLWRDYFGLCMAKDPLRYFSRAPKMIKQSQDPQRFDAALQKWVSGQTGVPFVDANMTELALTGFMSNRGRQNVASYLCNDLKLDWRYGAAYFEQQLIDYDVCSNWCNWAYLAGVGNDPRANRYFNIDKQAATYDVDGSYRRLWLGDDHV